MSSQPLKSFRSFSAPLFLLAVLASVCLSSVRAAAPEAQPSESALVTGEADEINVAPVIVDGETVLRVRGVTAFPAEKRADLIAGRIRAIAADRSISTSMLRIEETEGLTRILAGKQLVMVITDADARIEQLDRRNLANAYVSRISEAIRDYRRDRSTEHLARSGLYALAATGALVRVFVAGCARNETARQGPRTTGQSQARRNRGEVAADTECCATVANASWPAQPAVDAYRADRIPGLSGFPPAVVSVDAMDRAALVGPAV